MSTEKPFTMKVQGMHCGGCVSRVRKALEQLGVACDEVEIGTVRGTFDTTEITPEQLMAAIQSVGYTGAFEAADGFG